MKVNFPLFVPAFWCILDIKFHINCQNCIWSFSSLTNSSVIPFDTMINISLILVFLFIFPYAIIIKLYWFLLSIKIYSKSGYCGISDHLCFLHYRISFTISSSERKLMFYQIFLWLFTELKSVKRCWSKLFEKVDIVRYLIVTSSHF